MFFKGHTAVVIDVLTKLLALFSSSHSSKIRDVRFAAERTLRGGMSAHTLWERPTAKEPNLGLEGGGQSDNRY